jgi:hypothetical protein
MQFACNNEDAFVTLPTRVLGVHHVERNQNPFSYFRAFDINNVGSIESQLRDGNAFHEENMQSFVQTFF